VIEMNRTAELRSRRKATGAADLVDN